MPKPNAATRNDGSDVSHFDVLPLPGAPFGGLIRLTATEAPGDFIMAAEADPTALPDALYASEGLILVPGMRMIADEPALLVRLSRLFGTEVENYTETLTDQNKVHASVPEILVVSNLPPANKPPPPRPDPPFNADGSLPTRFPHRRGWHTDQSYRRPPPDISLFYAATAAPKGQGQTLYANGIAAYAALPMAMKERLDGVYGIHAMPGAGRSEHAVRAGDAPRKLGPHERPQSQPIVRTHPVTGVKALYLCEAGQMDWIDGPIVGMQTGPDGDGAKLVYELMSHLTQPQFTYVHEWTQDDLIIYDNRTLVHAATWFDAEKHPRRMWRTTVSGNPGDEYAGEKKSWIPANA
ncbi:MAG: TauD/TfdA family dioxygenase [Alphaproteobacteria bacterium]|nr:TauD/TfdA family dioxygenase [Alphaproteobacteria bacterium]